jgi:TRAP-type C4-dicarboxylate transport system permease large subunit
MAVELPLRVDVVLGPRGDHGPVHLAGITEREAGRTAGPAVKAAGIDLGWFGIVMVILVEIGLITPPIGFNLFVLQKLTGVSIVTSNGAMPFIGVMLTALLMFTLFPQIVTFLPNYF